MVAGKGEKGSASAAAAHQWFVVSAACFSIAFEAKGISFPHQRRYNPHGD